MSKTEYSRRSLLALRPTITTMPAGIPEDIMRSHPPQHQPTVGTLFQGRNGYDCKPVVKFANNHDDNDPHGSAISCLSTPRS